VPSGPSVDYKAGTTTKFSGPQHIVGYKRGLTHIRGLQYQNGSQNIVSHEEELAAIFSGPKHKMDPTQTMVFANNGGP
jgi:hypothetical protein